MKNVTLKDIKFPPVGGMRQFLVSANSQPIASFDTYDEAYKAKEMYSTTVKLAKGTALSANAQMNWTIGQNPNSK